jgi:hypothetical protein
MPGLSVPRERKGESRLTAALMERLGGEPHTRLRNSALYPIISQMERAPGSRTTTLRKRSSINSLGYWRVNGLILRGWALAQESAAEAGIELMCQNAADRRGVRRRLVSSSLPVHARCGLRANRSGRSGIARHRPGEGSSRAERRTHVGK